jgi:signal transduction histidine kinase/putative methionine-R-sulfoxide reductase with GAF domain
VSPRAAGLRPTGPEPVLRAIARTAARLCEATDALIHLVDGDRHRLVAQHGTLAHLQRIGDTHPIRRDTPLGRAVLERRPVHVHDVRVAVRARFRGLAQLRLDDSRVRTILVVPLLRDGVALGGIVIRRTRLRPFTARQITLLKTFAEQAVIAIENARLSRTLETRNQELSDALDRQTATADILRAISRSQTDVQPVFDAIADSAMRLFHSWSVAVYRFDGEQLHFGAARGGHPGSERALRAGYPRPPGPLDITGPSIARRAVYHVVDAQDADLHPHTSELARVRGVRTALTAPMLRDGEPVGTIAVTRAEVSPFSDAEIALLQTFADQAVIALENVRLFNELQARNRALSDALEQQTATSEILKVISSSPTDTQPVFDAIIRNAVRLCDAVYSIVWRLDGDLVDLVAHHNIPGDQLEDMRREFPRRLGDDPAEPYRSIRSGNVLHIPDIEQFEQLASRTLARFRARGVRSLLVVPMLREAEVVGAIGLTHDEVGAFAPSRIELVKTFADQAVIAVENARLFSQLQQRTGELGRSVEQLRALSEVGQAVSSTLDLDAVLQAIVTRAAQLAGTRGCSIWEYDERAEAFHLRATTILDAGIEQLLRSAGIRKGEGAIGRAAVTRAPVQIPDVSVAGAYEGPLRDALLRAGGGSVLTLPLLHEDRLLGGLTVSRRVTGEFPPDAVALLTAFAAQSAIALQNARLFRELEAKSRELEVASQHKSQFLANMSHELRTPLNAILGYGELIADGIYGEVPPAMRDVLGRVDASGRHLLGLINDVLDLSKIEAGQLVLALADYAMQEVVESVVASVGALASDKGLTLAVDLAPDLPTGRGDQRRLMQVLLNLVGNAIKFTEEGGIGVQVTAPGAVFEVSVRDTGPGIAPADQARIFEEFQQADTSTTRPKGGTGLGLAISRRIVGMHGGRLWVESVVGEGATFRFTVPVRVDQQVATGTSATA